MVFKIKATVGGFSLEPGVYPAVVKEVEPDESTFSNDGSVKFTFTVADSDQEPWAWSSQILSPASKLWRWSRILTSESPIKGEDYPLDNLVGRHCRLEIGTRLDAKGEERSAVLDILPANGAQTAPKAPTPAKTAREPDSPADFELGACATCGAPVDYYTRDGAAFCNAHGPRPASAEAEAAS